MKRRSIGVGSKARRSVIRSANRSRKCFQKSLIAFSTDSWRTSSLIATSATSAGPSMLRCANGTSCMCESNSTNWRTFQVKQYWIPSSKALPKASSTNSALRG